MAERLLYCGPFGPVVYDDEELLDDINFPGVKQQAVVASGNIVLLGAGNVIVRGQRVATVEDLLGASHYRVNSYVNDVALSTQEHVRIDTSTSSRNVRVLLGERVEVVGQPIIVKRTSGGANDVEVLARDGSPIDGRVGVKLLTQHTALQLIYNGRGWDIVSTYGSIELMAVV